MTVVLAVDPGRRKCGLAVVSSETGVLHRQVVAREDLGPQVRRVVVDFPPDEILVGGSTGSPEVVREVQEVLARQVRIVDERHSTERARFRYFRDHPPRGLWRLVPLGLQVPPGPCDDYAAVVLAEDYLRSVAAQVADPAAQPGPP